MGGTDVLGPGAVGRGTLSRTRTLCGKRNTDEQPGRNLTVERLVLLVLLEEVLHRMLSLENLICVRSVSEKILLTFWMDFFYFLY